MGRRVMVGGAIAHHPLGGAGTTWLFLQYILGLRRLGIETYYVEHIDAANCIDADWKPASFAASENARYFRAVMEQFGFIEHASLFEWEGAGHVGLERRAVEQLAGDTDLFINLSGRFHWTPILNAARRRGWIVEE